MYKSTRSNIRISASLAIIKGICEDGGLFIPEQIPSLPLKKEYLNYSYKEIAKKVLAKLLDDFSKEEIDIAVESAYDDKFDEEIIALKSFNGGVFLELHHGPTKAFKDMALAILPYLITIAKKKHHIDKKTVILTATSGDTGSAALASFNNVPNTEIFVVYPENGVSPIQEAQMLYYSNDQAHAYAYNGNFDDCQNLVKRLFSLIPENPFYDLTSANSINIGRLIPQVVYYYYAYLQMVNNEQVVYGKPINVSVPTGNFGNILACYIAKQMGLPIADIICASNRNNVLTEFFQIGTYNKDRPFYKTISPSMDILISSNLERLLAFIMDDGTLVKGEMSDLVSKGYYRISNKYRKMLEDFHAYSTSEVDTTRAISQVYLEEHYLIDPHTAVAYGAYLQYKSKTNNDLPTMIVSTASPYKFAKAVAKAIDVPILKNDFELNKLISKATNTSIPAIFEKIASSRKKAVGITEGELNKMLYKPFGSIMISAPATSANLGPGFDFLSIAYQKGNCYKFEIADSFALEGFGTFSDIDNNLVIHAYRHTFEVLQKSARPVKVMLVKQDVPVARGLGSSACCIVAGVLAANYYMGNSLTEAECLKIMTTLEGHADNVTSCYLGGLRASYRSKDQIKSIKYPVSEKLHFFLLIPDFQLATSVARSVLPKELTYQDATFNASRVVNLPYAFSSGDLELLKEMMQDAWHEPYRLPIIDDAKRIKSWCDKTTNAFCISGAGPTLLIISHDNKVIDSFKRLKLLHEWESAEYKLSDNGAILEVINE